MSLFCLLLQQGYAHTCDFLKEYIDNARNHNNSTSTPRLLSKIDESPRRKTSPQHGNNRPNDDTTTPNTEELNKRLSIALANFDELEFIDSCSDYDEEEELNRSLLLASRNAAANVSLVKEGSNVSVKEGNDLNRPIETEGIEDSDLNRPIKTDADSDDCVNVVSADIHCEFEQPTIEPDLRTSNSDCSQPISNSDTVDSGINVRTSHSDCSQPIGNSDTVDSGLHIGNQSESGIHHEKGYNSLFKHDSIESLNGTRMSTLNENSEEIVSG